MKLYFIEATEPDGYENYSRFAWANSAQEAFELFVKEYDREDLVPGNDYGEINVWEVPTEAPGSPSLLTMTTDDMTFHFGADWG